MNPDDQIDHQWEERFRRPNCQDVGEWRSAGGCVLLGEQPVAESARILDALFAAGAVRIMGIEVKIVLNIGLRTHWIVVEVPQDERVRARLFSVLNDLWKKDGWPARLDDGQRYQLLGRFDGGLH
jgi:hypothetical protein